MDEKKEAPTFGPPDEIPTARLKKVKRPVVEKGKDGKPVEKKVEIEATEVLSWRDYGDKVVVVTKDGKKFTDEKE